MTRKLRFSLLLAVVLLGLLVISVETIRRETDRSMQDALMLTGPVLLTIVPGSTLSEIATALEREGLIRHRLLFQLSARIDRVAQSLKAGTYEIRPGDNLAKVLQDFVAGRTKVFRITFIEGSRFTDMRRVLVRAPYLKRTLNGVRDAEIATWLEISANSLEGLFFPSTYEYTAYTEDRQILRRAYIDMQLLLDKQWQNKHHDLPYTSAYEGLIMASIIEKETGSASEREQIAGVFIRRLKLGMKLQTDPSVIYGLGDQYDGNIRRSDLTRDTPYNTYTRYGLPPTPIAMPGEAALVAAFNPAPGKALYFVAKGDGAHQFSDTLSQHNAAVKHYQLTKNR